MPQLKVWSIFYRFSIHPLLILHILLWILSTSFIKVRYVRQLIISLFSWTCSFWNPPLSHSFNLDALFSNKLHCLWTELTTSFDGQNSLSSLLTQVWFIYLLNAFPRVLWGLTLSLGMEMKDQMNGVEGILKRVQFSHL